MSSEYMNKFQEGQIRFCTSCGAKLSAGNMFCTSCGAKLSAPSSSRVPVDGDIRGQRSEAENRPVNRQRVSRVVPMNRQQVSNGSSANRQQIAGNIPMKESLDGKRIAMIAGGVLVVAALATGIVLAVPKLKGDNKDNSKSKTEVVADIDKNESVDQENSEALDEVAAAEDKDLAASDITKEGEQQADYNLKEDRNMSLEGEYLIGGIDQPLISVDNVISVTDGNEYIDNVGVIDLDLDELDYALVKTAVSGTRISVTGEGYISDGRLVLEVASAKDENGKDYKDIAGEMGTDVVDGDYILPDSASVRLTDKDIEKLSLRELNYAKNEIYARRGRRFDSPELRNYFESKSWYKGTIDPGDFSDNMLSEVEKANVTLIKNKEFSISTNGYQLDQ